MSVHSLDLAADLTLDTETQMLQAYQQAQQALEQFKDQQALVHNDQALMLSQQLDIPEHRWHLYQQRAVILERLGQNQQALAYWQQAIQQLNRIQAWHLNEPAWQAEMQSSIKRYVQQLLQQKDDQQSLSLALNAWETLKLKQISEYLGSACVIPQQTIHSLIAQQAGIAVIYPIVLDQHIEILVDIGGVLHRYSVQQQPARITRLIQRLHDAINQLRPEFPRYAKALHGILLKPLIPLLQASDIHTLVWIQDTALQGLALSALQNEQARFVVEYYAVVMSPSLHLLSNQVRRSKPSKVLLAGLANQQHYQSQNFPALPGVRDEIAWLKQHFDGDVLNDNDFSRENLLIQLQQTDYDIIHFATHAQIGSSIQDSYLLANNGAVPFAQLESLITARQLSAHPLELLTLSACQTAYSVNNTTLGLGGLLVQTGARSVLASLWQVDDSAAALLMQYFYTHWGMYNKAQALQRAQLQLLGAAYQHPFYWSGFILTGHWN
jgi:CHAT domain-containing protein